MRDFPSCFGENGVQISDASSSAAPPPPPPPPTAAAKTAQNLVTCVYHCKLHNSSSFIITITWSKTLMGHLLSAQINKPTNQSLCKLQIKPNLFTKSKGYQKIQVGPTSIHFFYDLSQAKFNSSPEPIKDFYFAITLNQELILQLGDMEKQLIKKLNTNAFNSFNSSSFSPNSILISKKEHIFGKKSYATTAQFNGKGQIHEILIECDTINTIDPSLVIRIDGKTVMQVKRLRWKFRGNYTILVDGLPVEVYWDVYDWFNSGKLIGGNGVFLFQTCLSAEKLWGSAISWSNSLVKDCVESMGLGFCLVLCVWKNE